MNISPPLVYITKKHVFAINEDKKLGKIRKKKCLLGKSHLVVISLGCAPTSITVAHTAGYYLTNKQTSAKDIDRENSKDNKDKKRHKKLNQTK